MGWIEGGFVLGWLVCREELVVGEVLRDPIGDLQQHVGCSCVDDGFDDLDEFLVVGVNSLVHRFAQYGVVAEQVAEVDVVVRQCDVHVHLVELDVALAIAHLNVALKGRLAVHVSRVACHGAAGLDRERQDVDVDLVLAVELDDGDLDAGAERVGVQVGFDLVDLEITDAPRIHVVAQRLEPRQARILHGCYVDLSKMQWL